MEEQFDKPSGDMKLAKFPTYKRDIIRENQIIAGLKIEPDNTITVYVYSPTVKVYVEKKY